MCKLCDSFNFRKVEIDTTLGKNIIALSGSLNQVEEYPERKFKYCPECGRKLTEEDFNIDW